MTQASQVGSPLSFSGARNLMPLWECTFASWIATGASRSWIGIALVFAVLSVAVHFVLLLFRPKTGAGGSRSGSAPKATSGPWFSSAGARTRAAATPAAIPWSAAHYLRTRQLVRNRGGQADFLVFDQKARARFPNAPDRRETYGLPKLETPVELWQFLGLGSYSELVWLADPSMVEKQENSPEAIRHYKAHYIPKRSGGTRAIHAPKPRLKAIQRNILREILDKIPLHDAATGFRRRRDITDHARPHVAKPMVVAYDLEDFFPSITQRRVAAFFQWLGYPSSIAHVLSLLCTVGDTWRIGWRSRRALPQGAPTSPALANAIAYRLDVRLSGLARGFGAAYTRYADDLAFSGGDSLKRGLSRFLPLAEKIIRDEGFRVHSGKRRFMRRGKRQQLTGLVVNDGLSVGRDEIDRLRAILFNAKLVGDLESQNRAGAEDFRAHLAGRIAWVARFHPARAAKLRAALAEIP